MIINHNMASLNTYRQLSANNANSAKSLEKLSSGLRINKAGDDAAGLAISEKMRGQIRGLDQAVRNSQDAISLIQTAEGSLSETHSILQRMKELATQAANSTNTSDDRNEIQKEVNQLTSEINRIGNTTEFNTMKLLDGSKSGDSAGTLQRLTAGTADKAFDFRLTVNDTDTAGSISVNMGTENGSLGNVTIKFVEDTDLGNGKGVVSYDKDSKVVTVATNGQVDINEASAAAIADWKFVDENGQEQTTLNNGANTDLADSIGQAIAAKETSFDASKVTVTIKNATGTAVAAGTTLNSSSIDGASVTTLGGSAAPNVAGKVTLVGLAGTSKAVELDFGDENGAALNGLKIEFRAAAAGVVTAGEVMAELGKDNNLIIYGNDADDVTVTKLNAAIQGLKKQTINGSEVDFAKASLSSWDDAANYVNGVTANNTDVTFGDLSALKGSSKLIVSGGESNNDTAPEGTGTVTGGALKMQIGANQGQSFSVSINDMRSLKLGISSIASGSDASVDGAVFTSNANGASNDLTDVSNSSNAEFALDVSDHDKATAAITVIDNAIKSVSAERSKLGAYSNRLEHTITNLGTSSENITAAESRIRDVDMAKEMMNFQKNNILSQAAQAMLAQANQAPQGVLQLLR